LSRRAFYKVILYSSDKGELFINDIAQKLNVQPNTIRKYLKILEKEGLVKPLGIDKYVLTEKGLKFKNSLYKIAETISVEPYVVTDPSTNKPLIIQIRNYKQLLAIIEYELAPLSILEEHLKRSYIAQWAENAVKDEYLVEAIRNGEIKSINDLREYLRDVVRLIELMQQKKR
jgi:predicted transcriptional regulator